MFKRKLTALDYHDANNFNISNEADFRNLIVWLEDQKIRHYKIEDREALRKISAGDWNIGYKKYLQDLECPAHISERPEELDWIMGYAVRLEYGDNVDKYKSYDSSQGGSGEQTKSVNPLDGMDFNSPDFKAGILSLSQMLQIPPHTDHAILTKAVCLLIKNKLSGDVLTHAQKQAKQGVNKAPKTIPLDKVELGFETEDYITKEAAKILRLLHIHELRELQTQINSAIVQVQALIANPKTDTRLGKVGR